MAIVHQVKLGAKDKVTQFSLEEYQSVIEAVNNKVQKDEHIFHGFKIELNKNDKVVSNTVQLYLHLPEKKRDHYAMHNDTYVNNKESLDQLDIVIYINDEYDEENDAGLQSLLKSL